MKYKVTLALLVFIILMAFLTFFRFENLYFDSLRENIKDVIYFILIGWFIYMTYQKRMERQQDN